LEGLPTRSEFCQQWIYDSVPKGVNPSLKERRAVGSAEPAVLLVGDVFGNRERPSSPPPDAGYRFLLEKSAVSKD
jgi:hypothetical protein